MVDLLPHVNRVQEDDRRDVLLDGLRARVRGRRDRVVDVQGTRISLDLDAGHDGQAGRETDERTMDGGNRKGCRKEKWKGK